MIGIEDQQNDDELIQDQSIEELDDSFKNFDELNPLKNSPVSDQYQSPEQFIEIRNEDRQPE